VATPEGLTVRRSIALLALSMLLVPATSAADEPLTVVLSPENNRLNAYDAATRARITLVDAASGDASEERGSPEGDRRDINGEICVDPTRPRHIITGEDTGQPERPAGWGYFEVTGETFEELAATQRGKLAPTYLGAPDNFGCGFLPDGRLFTSAIGDVYPGQPANGELILWFPPFDRETVPFCKVFQDLGTAGGIAVDPDGRVLVAANRPNDQAEPGGVHRFTPVGGWPTSADASGGCGRTDDTGAPLVDEGRVDHAIFIPSDTAATTPSDVAITSRGTYYVSSVFTGVVSEYDATGALVQQVFGPPGGLPIGQLQGATPFGLVVAPDDSLWIADLGIQGGAPIGGEGSIIRVPIDADGTPGDPSTIDEGLTFPDGLGVLALAPAARVGSGAGPGSNPAPAPATTDDGAPLPATGDGAAVALIALLGAGASIRAGRSRP
jgi:hypothetical protein